MPVPSSVRAVVAAGAALCLGQLGCVQTPTAQIHHINVQGATLAGAAVEVVIEIRNPNSFDLKVRDVTADTTFAGRYQLPTIYIHPDQWLPAGQTTQVHVPTVLPWLMIPGILAETVFSPVVNYRVRGTVNVTATRTFGVDEDNYPIDLQGQVPRNLMIQLGSGKIGF